MPTPFEAATTAALATIRNVAGRTVTYRRGASSVSVMSVPGVSKQTTVGEKGDRFVQRLHDELISVSDLVLDDAPVTPRAGDTIEVAIGAATKTFRVAPDANGDCWRYSDDSIRTTFRIHTREK